MTKTLELVFQTNTNKNLKFQLANVDYTATEEMTKNAMNAILKLNILKTRSGTPLKPIGAYLIDKTTTVIFENK